MTNKIEMNQIPFDHALVYVEEVVAAGGAPTGTVPKYAPHLDSVWALAPTGTDVERLLDFTHGGLLTQPAKISAGESCVQAVRDTLDIAAALIFSQLNQCSKPQLWIHEPLLTRGEAESRGFTTYIFGGCLYLVVDSFEDEKQMAKLLRWSKQSWHLLVCVTDSKTKVDSMGALLAATKFLLVGAYDGESCVCLLPKCHNL